MIEELIDKQYQSVLGFCRAMTQNDAQAQDLAQENFCVRCSTKHSFVRWSQNSKKAGFFAQQSTCSSISSAKSARESLTDEISPIPVEDESFSCVDMETLLLCLPEQDRVLLSCGIYTAIVK